MVATAQQEPAIRPESQHPPIPYETAAPIVAAVEPSTARVVADIAARLARELGAPLVFIYVRKNPSAILGSPHHERRLTKEMIRGRKTLDRALAVARDRGVMSYGEILEGDAAARILEVSRARRAEFVVVGQRRRRFGPSVLRRVIRSAQDPVVVAVKPVARSSASPRGRSTKTRFL